VEVRRSRRTARDRLAVSSLRAPQSRAAGIKAGGCRRRRSRGILRGSPALTDRSDRSVHARIIAGRCNTSTVDASPRCGGKLPRRVSTARANLPEPTATLNITEPASQHNNWVAAKCSVDANSDLAVARKPPPDSTIGRASNKNLYPTALEKSPVLSYQSGGFPRNGIPIWGRTAEPMNLAPGACGCLRGLPGIHWSHWL